MKIVVDTNILFSALVNPTGTISGIFLKRDSKLDFYTPSTALKELNDHRVKLAKASKLTHQEVEDLQKVLILQINVIEIKCISSSARATAVNILFDVDRFDIPILALNIDLKAKLWTGDKKLINGLLRKGYMDVINTSVLADLTK
ncbi:MAG: PIN domain-containing protein [Bacteroidota bacterium]